MRLEASQSERTLCLKIFDNWHVVSGQQCQSSGDDAMLYGRIVRLAERETELIRDEQGARWTQHVGDFVQQRDRDSRDAGAFNGGLNQTNGLHAHRSNGREEHHINPVGTQSLSDLWRGLFDQTLRFEDRTHEAEMAVVEAADRAARYEFTKTIQRKGQIAISLDTGMIEGIALVRFDQGARGDGVGNLADGSVPMLQETIETCLLRRMQCGGCYQR